MREHVKSEKKVDVAHAYFLALDGLRAVSIVLVLATHMLPLGPKVLRLNETAGAMGMSLFFSLSGFLIVSSLHKGDRIDEFLIKRLARILPLAYAYSLLVFTVVKFDPPSIFWTASLVENYFSSHLNVYNSHFWSLCVEFHFYLAIALICFLAGTRGVWIVMPGAVAITALRISEGAYIDIMTHLRADEILAGGCVALLWQRASFKRHSTAYLAVCTTAILWFLSSSPFTGWLQYIRPYATAAMLCSVLCHRDTKLARLLSCGPMQYLARISYALYVIHHATYQGWLDQGNLLIKYGLKRPLSFAITFALAHLSTFYWESRWQEAGRRWIKRRREKRDLDAGNC